MQPTPVCIISKRNLCIGVSVYRSLTACKIDVLVVITWEIKIRNKDQVLLKLIFCI